LLALVSKKVSVGDIVRFINLVNIEVILAKAEVSENIANDFVISFHPAPKRLSRYATKFNIL
jgi:hypothetical protein